MKLEPIPIAVDPRMYSAVFEGFAPLQVLIELIKNASDWRSKSPLRITIDTTDRNRIVVADNGLGMNVERRIGFVGGGKSTASDKNQNGIFGTGVKHALFSMAQAMRVRTIDVAMPDRVISFTLDRATWQPGESLAVNDTKKDTRSWPYDFASGTEISIDLLDPGSRRILRSTALARRLRALLPGQYERIIRVDGKPLPVREIVGEQFVEVFDHPALGQLVFDIYRPKESEPGESLRIGVSEIGEISMAEFQNAIEFDIPEVLLHPEVCGTIIVPAFRTHALQDRKSLKKSAMDDPNVRRFVDLLKQRAPDIQRRLKITLRSTANPADYQKALESAFESIRRAFSQKERPISGTAEQSVGDEQYPVSCPTPDSRQPITLRCNREFEVGEQITVQLLLAKDAGITSDMLEWNTELAGGCDVKYFPSGITMTATEVGHGRVMAYVRGKPINARCSYTIVEKRVLRLHSRRLSVILGQRAPIMAINMDRGPEPLSWVKDGVGELEPHGASAIYHARALGEAIVTVFGAERVNHASCTVVVTPDETDLLKIEDEWFKADLWHGGEHAGCVQMLSRTPVHALKINESAADFRAAATAGILADFLLMAIARAYVEFCHFELEEYEWPSPISEEAVLKLRQEIDIAAAKVFARILSGNGKK